MKAATVADKAAGTQRKKNRDEREFQAAALELTETPASPIGRATGYLIILFFLLAVAWAWIGRIDIHATMLGRVIPAGKVKVIEPLENGTVRSINVMSGDAVAAGDILIELDPTEAEADREMLARDLMMAQLDAARLRAALAAVSEEVAEDDLALEAPEGSDPELVRLQVSVLTHTVAAHRAAIGSIEGEIAVRNARRERTKSSIAERTQLVQALQERAEMLETLMSRQAGTRARYLELSRELYEERAILATERGQVREIASEVSSLERQRREVIARFLYERVTELAEVERRIAALSQELVKAARRDDRNRLTAPVAGTVQQLTVHTIGEVVTTDEKLMTIVPTEAALEVEAFLLNKDKGFVAPGQAVEIKVETFPFTKYGTIDGEVLTVSSDAVDHEQMGAVFPTRVAMSRATIWADGAEEQLTPGMSVTVEVKTGQRRVAEFLLQPFLRYRDEAIRER